MVFVIYVYVSSLESKKGHFKCQMKCPKTPYTTKTSPIFMQNPQPQWYESI